MSVVDDKLRKLRELEEQERLYNEQLRQVNDEFNQLKIISESTSEKITQDLHMKERDLFAKEEEIARLMNLEGDLRMEKEANQLLLQERNETATVYNDLDKKVQVAKKKLDTLTKMVRAEDERAEKIKTGMESHFKREDPGANTYDMVIKAESLQDLCTSGWPVSSYSKVPDTPSLVICAVGNYNRGKSFVLAMLSGKKIASGFSIHTEGISIIFPDNNTTPFTYLDTKGFETPIPKKSDLIQNMKMSRKMRLSVDHAPADQKQAPPPKEENGSDTYNIENDIKDRKMCELLLQHFLLEQSDIILIVVGNLTFSDQMLIHRTIGEYSMNRGKRIVIIHNFSTFVYKKNVEEAMKNEIEDVFDVKKQWFPSDFMAMASIPEECNKCYYVNNKFKEIVHVIMAMEGTEAGNYYNPSAKQYMLSSIVQNPNRKVFNIEQALHSYLLTNLQKYLIFESGKPLPLEYDEYSRCFKLNINTMDFKAVQFDALDRRMTKKDSNDTATYDLKTTKDAVILNVELPGMTPEEIQAMVREQCLKNKDGYYVVVKGRKLEEIKEVKQRLEGTRIFGEFEIVTRTLEYSQFEFANFSYPERVEQEGLLSLKWDLRPTNTQEPIKQSFF